MALHSGPVACLLCFAACVPATAGQGSPPRMAICFVGHAKAFVDPRVRANVVQNLLEPLRRQAPVVDVIVRMKPGHNEYSMAGHNGTIAGIEELGGVDVAVGEAACETCRENATFSHCGAVNATEREARGHRWERLYGRYSMSSCLGTVSSFRGCADAIRENERRAGERYDVVLRTRGDLFFPEPVPRPCAWPRDEVIEAGCDQFLAGSRDVVVPMLDAGWADWVSCRPEGCGAARVEDVVLRAYRNVARIARWPESWNSEGVRPPFLVRLEENGRTIDRAVAAARATRSFEPPCYEDAAPPLDFLKRHC